MPFDIIRPDALPQGLDAMVVSIPKQSGLFAPKAGTAKAYPVRDPRARWEIRAVRPAWAGGNRREGEILKKCYLEGMRLAVLNGCASVALYPLAEGEPDFPKSLDCQVALDAVREFLRTHELQVYVLTGSREKSALLTQQRDELNRLLSTMGETKSGPPEDQTQNSGPKIPHRDWDWELRHQSVWALRTNEDGTTELVHMPPPDEPEFDASREPLPPSMPCEMPPSQAQRHTAPMPPAPRRVSMDTAELPDLSHPGLTELLERTDAGFSDTLLKLIDASGKKDSEVYARANVSRQHFSKIRNNPGYRPTKVTAIAFAIALELDLEQTKDLIGRAGYALTNSSKFDVIIMYFIRQGIYDIYEINTALFAYDQLLLGA